MKTFIIIVHIVQEYNYFCIILKLTTIRFDHGQNSFYTNGHFKIIDSIIQKKKKKEEDIYNILW